MSIDKQWVVNLQGKDYVQFPGLLDLAHQNGLRSIETELVQMPTTENGEMAVMRAIGRFAAPEGDAIWSAYGDASPQNVNRMIRTALLRMAETRAIGRMLRMATNVGQTMLEELPGQDDEAPANHAHRPPANGKPAPVSPSPASRVPGAASRPPAAAAPPTVCFCQFPKCETEIDQTQKDASEKAYGVAVCEKHSYLQPQPATTSKGEPILCAECQQQLTNNEVLLSHRDCKRKLCYVHRIEAIEAKNAETAAVPA